MREQVQVLALSVYNKRRARPHTTTALQKSLQAKHGMQPPQDGRPRRVGFPRGILGSGGRVRRERPPKVKGPPRLSDGLRMHGRRGAGAARSTGRTRCSGHPRRPSWSTRLPSRAPPSTGTALQHRRHRCHRMHLSVSLMSISLEPGRGAKTYLGSRPDARQNGCR